MYEVKPVILYQHHHSWLPKFCNSTNFLSKTLVNCKSKSLFGENTDQQKTWSTKRFPIFYLLWYYSKQSNIYIHVETKSNHRSQKRGFNVKLWVKRKKTYDVFCFNVKTCVEHEEVIIFASELNTKERALDLCMYSKVDHINMPKYYTDERMWCGRWQR